MHMMSVSVWTSHTVNSYSKFAHKCIVNVRDAEWQTERTQRKQFPLRQHAGEEDATLFENLWWKSWTNVHVSSVIIYDPLQLCKYQCWATFLTANDGLSFCIIMTDQHWIIHPRALKYAITLQLLRIHLSCLAIRLEKAALLSTQV